MLESITSLTGGTSNYAAGTLQVVKTTDEDGHVSYAFTDRLGRTLLIRRMNGDTQHDTYYVYDTAGNLRYVLQPEYQTTADLAKYAFQYEYDTYNRCVRKTLPGASYVAYEYDTKDRLVFSQDGNQRGRGKWTYYEYDNHGRLTEQGECVKNGTTVTGKTVWVKNYYDEYDFLSEPGFADGDYVVTGQDNGKGHLTGRALRTTDGGTIAELICYDEKGRESWVMRNNLLGEREIYISSYTYSGKPYSLVTILMGEQLDSTSLIVGHSYTYDHSDRLSKVEHYLNTGWTTLAEYAYDNLDRLASKKLHGSAANQLTYSYNIRDWLTGITGTRFTQNLYYNTGNGTPCYNGNISSMTWRSGNEATTRGYKFAYDGLDRLTTATYGEGTSISGNANWFTEKVTSYDKNGNIKGLQRYGQASASTYGLIDNLTFTLDGNRPTRVDDAVSTAAYNNGFEFKDAVKQSGEYDYDYNGNLTKDLNRGIDTITYNFLNLPDKVEFSDGSTIEYVYAADGTKLRTKHTIGGATTTTDYCGDVIYENGVRKYVLTEEGYVTLADNKYHYYLKDHQGNHRVVVDQSGTVEETNHYYPFGGVFASTASVQPYKYNGKEFDSKKGLNWYDYGARMYDPALGRFTTVDPMAEKYYNIGIYSYCLNNPIKFIDENGLFPRIYIERKGLGHAFVTIGNGNNTIVYTYGRYGELGKNKSSARSTSPTGEGVLIKLEGRDAINFIQDQMLVNEAIGYEFVNGSDKAVSEYFDTRLQNSDRTPQQGKYAGKENAKVIDEYNLFTNNCATTSVKAVQEGVKKELDLEGSKSPASLGDRLEVMSQENEYGIRKINYDEIKKELKLHGAGTKW